MHIACMCTAPGRPRQAQAELARSHPRISLAGPHPSQERKGLVCVALLECNYSTRAYATWPYVRMSGDTLQYKVQVSTIVVRACVLW